MKLKLLALVVLLAVGAGAVILAMGGIAAASDQPRYLTSTVTRGTISQDVTSTGTVAASTTYGLIFGSAPQLGASSSGTTWLVDTLKVKVGDQVKKGQVLAKAATASLRAQLDQANATWQSAK